MGTFRRFLSVVRGGVIDTGWTDSSLGLYKCAEVWEAKLLPILGTTTGQNDELLNTVRVTTLDYCKWHFLQSAIAQVGQVK